MVRSMKAVDGEIEVPEFLSEARLSTRDERILANHRILTKSAAKKKRGV
jgi:hypothetical protein